MVGILVVLSKIYPDNVIISMVIESYKSLASTILEKLNSFLN